MKPNTAEDTLVSLTQGQPLAHTPRTFSAKLLPSQLAPRLWWGMKTLLIYSVKKKIMATFKITLAPQSN